MADSTIVAGSVADSTRVANAVAESTSVSRSARAKRWGDHLFFAVKTNLLYDAILVPNIGVELNIYRDWSVYGDLMYAGWEIPIKHYYWDLFGAQAGVRKYFGKKSEQRRFAGHHVGIYGQALAYDLQAGNIGQQTPSINIGVGVEYGYSFPVAQNLNIDLELGFGYLGGKYDEYDVTDDHNTWRGTVQRNWVGPTKASVSLVWLFRDVNQEARLKAKDLREQKKDADKTERKAVDKAKKQIKKEKKEAIEAERAAEEQQKLEEKKAAEAARAAEEQKKLEEKKAAEAAKAAEEAKANPSNEKSAEEISTKEKGAAKKDSSKKKNDGKANRKANKQKEDIGEETV